MCFTHSDYYHFIRYISLESRKFDADGLMLSCHPLPGASAACELRCRPQSVHTLPCSTRAISHLEEFIYRPRSIAATLSCSTRATSHLEEFTYRPQSSPLKAPSLRRGWILSRNDDVLDSGLELLLSRPELHQEVDLPQEDQWIAGVESQHLVEGNGVSFESVNVGRLSNGLLDEDQNRDEEDRMILRYVVDGNGVSVESVNNGRVSDGLLQDDQNKDEEDRTILKTPKYVRGPDIDKKSFIRVYYISALRIPAAECWDLVFELREHLLNWPRVKNIGRVQGDDVDEDLVTVFDETSERKQRITPDEIRAAVYSGSETELAGGSKLAGETTRKGSSKQGIVRSREAATMLELIETTERESEQEVITPTAGFPHLNLLKKWAGPTRLLLLDEKYAGKRVSELPYSLQVVYSRFGHLSSKAGLVNCRLTIFYEYWSMDEVLQELLPAEASAPVKFDRAGHVAVLRLQPKHHPFRHLIAQVTLDKYKPTVRSVVVKRDILYDKQYAVQLELLAGTTSLLTTAWEHDIPYRIDMASVLWDPRLSSERQRLVNSFSDNDLVCDLCAGVGPVAIPASKKVRRVYANEVNPHAYFYFTRNVVENEVSGRVEVFNEDIQTFLSKIFHIKRPLPITQVVMSHPSAKAEFLEFFQGLFSQRTWSNVSLPRIHLHGISRDSDPEESFSKEIAAVLQTSNCEISTHLVTEMSRGEWMGAMVSQFLEDIEMFSLTREG